MSQTWSDLRKLSQRVNDFLSPCEELADNLADGYFRTRARQYCKATTALTELVASLEELLGFEIRNPKGKQLSKLKELVTLALVELDYSFCTRALGNGLPLFLVCQASKAEWSGCREDLAESHPAREAQVALFRSERLHSPAVVAEHSAGTLSH